MIVVEITAAIDDSGTEQTFYISEGEFNSLPTDIPPNKTFLPRLNNPGSLGVSAYTEGRNPGASQLQTGEISIVNVDGRLDPWLNYGFDKRRIVIYEGTPGDAYPTDWKLLYTGTADAVTPNWDDLVIRLKDLQIIFDQTVLTTRFLGNNSPPNGVEGDASLKDVVKPLLFGVGLKITPKLVNSQKLIYMIHNGRLASVDAVYYGGAVATYGGTDYATNAALQAATGLTSARWYTCLAEGLIRLATDPSGLVTADATAGATAADRTAGQILKSLALLAGIAE